MRPTAIHIIMTHLAALLLAVGAGAPACAATPTARKSADAPSSIRESPAVRAFLNLDVDVLDLLSRDTRDYMISYRVERDSNVLVANELNGLSRLDTLTPGYLKVRLTDVSTLQLKVLEAKKGGRIVMSVYTIGGSDEAADSEVRFFSYPGLAEIPADRIMKAPRLDDFFSIPRGCSTDMKEIRGMIPFPTYVYEADADSSDLSVRLSIGDYLNVDDYNILKIFLLPSRTYTWENGRYRLTRLPKK